MTSKQRKVAQIQQLTSLALQKAQSDLAQLNARAQALRRNLSDLTAQRSHRAQTLPAGDDPAFLAGADLRWQQWTDQRRAVINMELARVLALIDQSEGRLRRAFGRDQVVQTLAGRMQQDAKLRQSPLPDQES